MPRWTVSDPTNSIVKTTGRHKVTREQYYRRDTTPIARGTTKKHFLGTLIFI